MASAIRRRVSRPAPRFTRRKPMVSYAESASKESESESSEPDSDETAHHRPTRPSRTRAATRKNAPRIVERTTPPPKHPRAPSKRGHKSLDDNRPRAKRSKPNSPKSNPSASFTGLEKSGVIPAWDLLPYHILVAIFEYATYPLYDDRTFQSLPSGRWLLDVAYLCRNFAEPALTVLYRSPPLVPMVQAHRLVDLLEEDPKSLAYSYRQKVKSLRIDVGQVAAYSLPGRGHLDLYSLIKDLPQLVELEFYHQKDMSPYRELDATIKWNYPESLFDALEHVSEQADERQGGKTRIRTLHSWRWSSRLAGKKWPLEKIPEMHSKPFFASLTKIAFVNYQVSIKGELDAKDEQTIGKALAVLPNLKHLIFESSTLMNSDLLPLLPKSLRNLELISCWEVTADDFASFLLTHGHQLRVLTLNHNQSLSLSFLPVIGQACPELQVFRMNLTYFNLHATYRDSEPQYKQLLLADQIPVWPSKLQTIELTQLRQWENDAAEMFFQSLLDSAGQLKDLRRLTIQAILNIGWRDRASFRDKWVGSLQRVFKRACVPPRPVSTLRKLPQVILNPNGNPTTVAIARRISARPTKGTVVTESFMTASARPTGSQKREKSAPRRSARASARSLPSGKYAESSDQSEEDEDYEEDFESSIPIVRRPSRPTGLIRELEILKRTAGIDSPSHTSSPKSLDSSSEGAVSDSEGNSGGKKVEAIQGMCEVVEIRIDNLRPMENQFTADDFLGPPESDDEEWNGDDDNEV